MADNIDKWRGLKAMVQDAVEQGAAAVERVHLETAKRPFGVIKSIAPLEKPTEGIEAIHDTIVSGAYASVRLVNKLAGRAVDAALDVLEDTKGKGTADAAEQDESDASSEPPSSKA
jgi:hypothetical protein